MDNQNEIRTDNNVPCLMLDDGSWQTVRARWEASGSMNVSIQDQTSEIVDLFLHRTLWTFTVSANTVVDVNTFEATAWHWMVIWNTVCFVEWLNFSQFTVVWVSVNTITVDSSFDRIYTTSTTFERHTPEMSVNWSVTPQTYFIKPASGVKYDITRIILVIEDWSSMDTATFWGIAPLTNWCLLRKKDWIFKNLMNWKTNWEWMERSFDWIFDDKAPSGSFWFRWRSTFWWQDKRGVTIRLDWSTNDELQLIVQDDLTGLSKMRIIAQWHVVVD